jgi:acid phosphatase family membrane protein YuiD
MTILILITRNIIFIKAYTMNTVIIAAGISWIVAQGAKVLFGLMKYGINDKPRIVWRVVWAGGMPSAHSALIASTTLTILLSSGAQSLLFGLSLVISCIVIYDRSRMYSIYDTFQKKYPVLREEVQKDPVLKDLVGHRLPEVLAGVLIGFSSGLLTFLYL